MAFERRYDPEQKQLIYLGAPATPEFWDQTWESQCLSREDLLSTKETTWSRVNKEFLRPEDGPIIEGGCGFGIQVAAIHNDGYSVTGIDFAPKTVQYLKSIAPEMDFREGDVRNLELPDSSQAGYWSLGVIEHFWDGYDDILMEAYRVLQQRGIFFLVFPFMNPVRSLKGRIRLVSRWDKRQPENFYQFALRSASVVERCRKLGFELVEQRTMLPTQGLAEELPRFSSFMKRLNADQQLGVAKKVARRVLQRPYRFLASRSCYSQLLVLRKP